MTRTTVFLLAMLLSTLSWAREADAPASLYTAYFDVGSARMAAADRAAIRRLAGRLGGRRLLRVVGRADGMGPSEYNALLAMRRAEAAFRVLVNAGHPARLIQVEARPANHTATSRREVRRVDVLAAGMSPKRDDFPPSLRRDPLRVGRYWVVAPVPTEAQRDPLRAIVRIAFPQSVTRIGEALDYLLARSGWRFAGGASADPTLPGLLAMPLPESQRRLGPVSLLDAVNVLCGSSYDSVVDPVHRLVSCELKPGFAKLYRRGTRP